MSTTNLPTVASGMKRATGGCRRHPPSLTARAQPAMPSAMERDMPAQAQWLAKQASNRGYPNLDELLQQTPHLYTQLASRWRRMHPLFEAA